MGEIRSKTCEQGKDRRDQLGRPMPSVSDTRLSRQNLSQDVRAIPSAGFLPPWCKSPRRFCLRLCREEMFGRSLAVLMPADTPPRPGHWGAGEPSPDWDGKVLPHEVWQGMSEHAQLITAGIKAEPGADVTKAPWSPEADLHGERDAAPTHCYPLAHQLKRWLLGAGSFPPALRPGCGRPRGKAQDGRPYGWGFQGRRARPRPSGRQAVSGVRSNRIT